MARWVVRAVPAVIVVAILGAGLVIGFSRVEEPPAPRTVTVDAGRAKAPVVAASWPKPTASLTVAPATPTSFTVADAIGPTVDLYAAPDVPYEPKPSLANPTHEGLPVVFLVKESRGDWLKVQVSSRPNELLAWVKTSQVAIRTVPNRIVVEVGTRKLTVYHGDTVLLQDSVAVGTGATPTPTGSFFVDGWVPLSGSGPYGAGQLSVAAFSNVLHSFGGGVGQIAIHGTNRPNLMGQAVSNGCVRTHNDTVTRLALLAPLGTPVQIVP